MTDPSEIIKQQFYTFIDAGNEILEELCVAVFGSASEVEGFLAEVDDESRHEGSEPDSGGCRIFRITVEEIPRARADQHPPAPTTTTEISQALAGRNE